MEGDNSNSNTVPQMGTAAEPRVLPVSEGVEVAGGLEEKLNYVGGDDGHGGVAVGQAAEGAPSAVAWEEIIICETAAESAGSNFTPHTITIQPGENIVQTSVHFLKGLLNQFAFFQLLGRFEIVSLTGSHSNNAAGGGHSKICLLSVQLANPDGGLFGGAVAGSLIAGGPTQMHHLLIYFAYKSVLNELFTSRFSVIIWDTSKLCYYVFQLVIATFRQKFREQPKVQHHIEPSKPNQVAVAVSLQTANGTFPDSEMNGLSLSTAPPVPAPPVDGMDKGMNGPDVNHASPQPFDWNSLQSSAHMSQHVLPSDVNTGAAD
ncbi:UNVERIFIED_CONTAM: AT-hook motif nuclear-localized protein 6 [Sesamum calycinum]|uniref:AT-hook motif nuclear-localized protein n=1 Tax=Sesamum calycinum TaxID=2727403 RepID=A0AAW2SDW4_9LAMI